jgi:hypothetical protein
MPNNVLDYVNYDFDDLVLQIQTRLKADDSWQDIYRSGAGNMLIEFLAYVLNLGLYYTERRANESYLLTARHRSSVVNLVALLNYQPRRKTSSTGNLIFSIASALTKIVYIPKYTECQTADGTKFLTNESAAIEKGQTSIAVSSIQGELLQKDITANGTIDQEYLINDTGVENSASTTNATLRVIVDGVEWSLVSSFLGSTNTDKNFRVINEPEGTVSILFGNNVNGLAPALGSIIVIQYVKTVGSTGNVTFPDKITTLNSTIYDEDGTAVTTTVTNSDSFLGGSDEETIEEIKSAAPQVFSTGDRAVSKNDFTAILEAYSSVESVNTWGENEEALAAGVSADSTMLNKVKISLVLQNWELPDAAFKATLSTFLYDISMLTVKYEFVTPVILAVFPVLYVTVTKGYSLSQTQADIGTVLANQFLLGTTTNLGTIIKYSQVLSAINDLAGVAYASMVFEIKKLLSSTYSSDYDWGAALDATVILPESTRVFVDGTYAVTDVNGGSGTGTFTASGISGTINYTTGVVLLNVTPAATSVYVRYQQDEKRNIVPTFNEIAKLDTVDIQSISMDT